MNARYHPQIAVVFKLANEEAVRLGHEYIGTEHLLIGLVAGSTEGAAQVWSKLNVDVAKVRREIYKIIQRGEGESILSRLPMTPRAKKIFEYACEEARQLGHDE